MAEKIREFWRNDSGATAIEYGLIAAIAGVGMIASLGTLKNALSGMFGNVTPYAVGANIGQMFAKPRRRCPRNTVFQAID